MILTPKQEQLLDIPQKMSIVVGPPASGKSTMCILSAIRAARSHPGYTVVYLVRFGQLAQDLFRQWRKEGSEWRVSSQVISFPNKSSLRIRSFYDAPALRGMEVDWLIIDKGGMPMAFPSYAVRDERVTIVLDDDWATIDMGAVWREK